MWPELYTQEALDKTLAIKKFLSKEGVWGQGSYAVDREGKSVGVTSKDAASFCLIGAYKHLYPEENTAFITMAWNTNLNSAITFNDKSSTTQKEVLIYLQRKIKFLKNKLGKS